MKYYDDEERELIETLEREEAREVQDMTAALAEATRIARATSAKTSRMNIRMSEKDLKALKACAIDQGLPYQSLVSSVLHKYVAGQLIEREPHKSARGRAAVPRSTGRARAPARAGSRPDGRRPRRGK